MNNKKLSSIVFATALGSLAIALACCSGGTDGGTAAEEDFSDGQFVGSDGSTGTITVNVLDRDMSVGETSGFGVAVKNSAGNGVGGMKVFCDSEQGVAILEPTSGHETTNSHGDISGVIGCAAPGSYQFACRLPVGVNKRQLVDIVCRGPVPDGFTGFPNAAGGGLGGGSDTSDSGGIGGSDTDGVRTTTLLFVDDGSNADIGSSNFSIDVSQGICTAESGSVGAGTPTPTPVITVEPFFDTVLKVRVVNNTNQTVRFSSMKYTVVSAGVLANSGSDFVSDTVSFIGEANAIEGGGGEGTFTMLAINATSGAKRFVGSSTDIPSNYGFKTVRVTVIGTNDNGDDIQATASQTLDFSDFNRCTN